MTQGPVSSVLVTIRITVRIQESEDRNLHSLDFPAFSWVLSLWQAGWLHVCLSAL